MSDLIRREDVQREIQASFDGCALGWQDWQDLMDRINAIPPASPWHRVEDELPPKATWVLTVATDGNAKIFNIATVDAGGQWWTCSPQNILRELYGVRYWMPIEPPQEVQE